MKIQVIECDCCGTKSDPGNQKWDEQYSVFSLNFPRDGTNHGLWNMDVCHKCRHTLFDAIASTVESLRRKK